MEEGLPNNCNLTNNGTNNESNNSDSVSVMSTPKSAQSPTTSPTECGTANQRMKLLRSAVTDTINKSLKVAQSHCTPRDEKFQSKPEYPEKTTGLKDSEKEPVEFLRKLQKCKPIQQLRTVSRIQVRSLVDQMMTSVDNSIKVELTLLYQEENLSDRFNDLDKLMANSAASQVSCRSRGATNDATLCNIQAKRQQVVRLRELHEQLLRQNREVCESTQVTHRKFNEGVKAVHEKCESVQKTYTMAMEIDTEKLSEAVDASIRSDESGQ